MTLDCVRKYLRGKQVSKATGLDGLNARLLKDGDDFIAIPILQIINTSINITKFPISMKEAKVMPLHKGGSKEMPENYRPILVLSVLSKILERIVHNQVYEFFQKEGLLNPAQSGFRKLHSTTTCALSVVNDIFVGMDNGEQTGILRC